MISGVQGKAFRLAEYDIFAGDPGFYRQDMQNMMDVTIDDVKNAYEKYIKGKNYVATSFVPKGKVELAAAGSADAGIQEENILTATEVKIEAGAAEEIKKTPTSFDRSVTSACLIFVTCVSMEVVACQWHKLSESCTTRCRLFIQYSPLKGAICLLTSVLRVANCLP
jgi:hypothetical protein